MIRISGATTWTGTAPHKVKPEVAWEHWRRERYTEPLQQRPLTVEHTEITLQEELHLIMENNVPLAVGNAGIMEHLCLLIPDSNKLRGTRSVSPG